MNKYYAVEFAPGRWSVISPRGNTLYTDDDGHGWPRVREWNSEDRVQAFVERCNDDLDKETHE